MRIKTRRGVAVFVGCVMCAALALVNTMNLFLMTPEDHLKHLVVATIEIAVVSVCIGTFVGLKLRQITHLNERLEHAVSHDHLTGAKTRQYFYAFMQRDDIWPCTVIMTDIDSFKQINDTFGHHAGDLVLKDFVGTLSSLIRKEDILARFGGEEFVIALPNTTFKAGARLAERMRKRVAAVAFTTGEDTISATASFGICEIQHGGEVKQAIQRADEALYLAKHNGRNQVHISDRSARMLEAG